MPSGEWQKTFTMLTIIIHFVHPLLCVANYLDWVRYEDQLSSRMRHTYLAATIIATIMYLMVASVFYMWAYRWPLPEEYAQRRRIYGVMVNLLFSDIPIFAIEVNIIWQVGIVSGIQGATFFFTCLSFGYSAIRSWIYLMIAVIKATKPQHHLGGPGMGTIPMGYPPPTHSSYNPRTTAGLPAHVPTHFRPTGITSSDIAARQPIHDYTIPAADTHQLAANPAGGVIPAGRPQGGLSQFSGIT
eukprot:TRINITY_DN12593_c0_g1_i1.p1 TRINITY_DN12593_c0_g1~~TRINITY_DN12593_c0_g1_i1.p1  ORF type:complete len:243 (+),score=18.22 TRINITY_DN12593_c0_g1_i1:556-1284(+)